MHHVVHRLEPSRTTVVRVRHIVVAFLRIEVPEEAEAGRSPRQSTRHVLEVPEVLAVHRYDQVEVLHVPRCDLARRSFQMDAMGRGHPDGAAIWRLTGVPSTGACRVDLEQLLNVPCLDEITEDPLGQRRTADVAEADKEDGGAGGVWRRDRHGGGTRIAKGGPDRGTVDRFAGSLVRPRQGEGALLRWQQSI